VLTWNASGEKFIEREAEEDKSGDEEKAKDAAEDSSEENVNEPNEYQADGFVVSDDKEGDEKEDKEEGENNHKEDGEDGEAPQGEQRKKRKKKINTQLDEDDLELIEGNLGVKVRKTSSAAESSLKRLKRHRPQNEDGMPFTNFARGCDLFLRCRYREKRHRP
jgi:hypothetical protein